LSSYDETLEPLSDYEMANLPSPAKRLKYAIKSTTNEDSPADQLPRYDLAKPFEVLVGATPDQQSFTVYHDIATKRSDFFRVARSSRWTDPKKPTELVDDQPSVFHAYLHCLYFDEKVFLGRKTEAHAADNSNGNSSSSSSSQVGETMRFVLDLYIIADKLLDPTTANIVMDKIIRQLAKKHWTLDHTTVGHVYASTADGSLLRNVVRDWYIQDLKKNRMGGVPKKEWGLPHEFLQDLLIETARLINARPRESVGTTFGDLMSDRKKGYYHLKVVQKFEHKTEETETGKGKMKVIINPKPVVLDDDGSDG